MGGFCLLTLRGCGVFDCVFLWFLLCFFGQEISSDFVGLDPIVSLSPRCLSYPLAVCVKSLFEIQICAFLLEISCHVPPNCFHRRLPVWPSQLVVASLFPDWRMACTHRETSFPDQRVRATLRYSSLVCGSWWWLGAAGVLGRHEPTQAMIGSFSARVVDVFFLFEFVYYCLFTVYLCNGLILYGLLSDF
jgi:hypothetical protein